MENKQMVQISKENYSKIVNFMLSGTYNLPMANQLEIFELAKTAKEILPEVETEVVK